MEESFKKLVPLPPPIDDGTYIRCNSLGKPQKKLFLSGPGKGLATMKRIFFAFQKKSTQFWLY